MKPNSPQPYEPSQPVVFQHIPKCAGTSVKKVFTEWFGEHLYSHYYDNCRNSAPERVDLAAAQAKAAATGGSVCLFGHFNAARGLGYRDYYPELNQILTIIRDPFEHHVSDYFYAKKLMARGKVHLPLVKVILEEGLQIEDYVSHYSSYLPNFLPDDLDEGNYRERLREEYLFIGLTERLDESIRAIGRILGKPSRRVEKKNVSPRDRDVSELRKVFEQKNPFVVELYRECCLIFEERCRKSLGERLLAWWSKRR